jgi:hypothetical protein
LRGLKKSYKGPFGEISRKSHRKAIDKATRIGYDNEQSSECNGIVGTPKSAEKNEYYGVFGFVLFERR